MLSMARVRALGRIKSVVPGRCPVCGRSTAFVLTGPNVREDLQCPWCRSSSRNRHVALVVADILGGARDVGRAAAKAQAQIFIADYAGPVAKALAEAPGVARSGYVPQVPLGGSIAPGVTCQDLEKLGYPDTSFDLVITEDVLEHVRDPAAAFAEIRRVLRPGGTHVFTIPYFVDRRTLTRVDTSGRDDVMLMEPEWHGDSIRGRILSYRTFGYDLLDELRDTGWEVTLRQSTFHLRRAGVYDSVVLVATRR